MHRLHDGTILRLMSARELTDLPVWKGNRILDTEHVAAIRKKIADIRSLDSGYRIIRCMEANGVGVLTPQLYLIDGQHRAAILREHFRTTLCEPDFMVVVMEKDIASETEAIDYFNLINTVKPQQWRTDPALLVNQYIAELERRFNTKKMKLIRQGSTCRPYLSVDRLREALRASITELPQEAAAIQEFGERAFAKNQELVAEMQILVLGNTKDSRMYERVAEVNFALAVDLGWIKEC
jgi:hypothetical protein